MFHKTRTRLTVLNTVIFFLILSIFSATIYFYVKNRLYANIDASLQEQAKKVQLIPNGFGVRLDYPSPAVIDQRVFFVARDRTGNITAQSPGDTYTVKKLENKETVAFLPELVDKPPATVIIDQHHFRVLNISRKSIPVSYAQTFDAETNWNYDVTSNQSGIASAISAIAGVSPIIDTEAMRFMTVNSPVATMQFMINMDPELNMLQSLMIVILAGVAISGLLTLLAGFYLAQRALIPIRDSWDKQQQFVADASHELRTPLAVIQANTELLLRHPDHSIEQESSYISTILKESKRINKLVASLLTFARSDSNQLEIQPKLISLDQLISESIHQFTPLAELKQITMKAEIDHSIEMMADEERIHQLLVILFDNALKYTPEQGTIHITCSKAAHAVNLVVEDTGIGIPEADMPFIFERFFRGDKIRSRFDGGTGLGLSIAYWIVEKHGGKIRAESQLGAGTRMLLAFPAKR